MARHSAWWWLIVSTLLLSGCPLRDDADGESSRVVQTSAELLSALTLRTPASCQAYRDYVTEGVIDEFIMGRFEPLSTAGFGDVTRADAFSASNAEAPTEVTRTNVQEAGVDEADIVKTDSAGRIYSLSGEWLVIAQAYPPENMRELARLQVVSAEGSRSLGLYVDETRQRAVAITQYWEYEGPAAICVDCFRGPVNSTTELIFIDIARPSKPEISARLQLDGHHIDSRMIDGRIHLVSGFHIPLPESVYHDQTLIESTVAYRRARADADISEEGVAALRAELDVAVRRHLDQTPIEQFLPASEWQELTGRDAGLVGCDTVLMPEMKFTPRLVAITSVNSDGSAAAATAVMNSAWQVYASATSLYLIQGSWGWWSWGSSESHTALYKFDISGARPDGWIKDSYSLSEHADHLRVVTSEALFDSATDRWVTSHRLSVLRDDAAGELVQTGGVSGFGENESVRAVRLLGERGFVVTFRQIDPLFGFDLSDPNRPRLLGELEIPGFSTYMHPLGDDHLLTIGRGGDLTDMQLQLFDVSDLAAPRLVHRHTIDVPKGYSWSAAQYDPHAFTYLESQGLLAIPLSTWDPLSRESFTGMVVYKIDAGAGIAELGRVQHDDLAANRYCTDLSAEMPQWKLDACQDGRYSWLAYPSRAVFMRGLLQTYLYSISNIGIKATRAEQPHETLGTLLFPIEYPRMIF